MRVKLIPPDLIDPAEMLCRVFPEPGQPPGEGHHRSPSEMFYRMAKPAAQCKARHTGDSR